MNNARLAEAARIIEAEDVDVELRIGQVASIVGLSERQFRRRLDGGIVSGMIDSEWPEEESPKPIIPNGDKVWTLPGREGELRWKYSELLGWLASRPLRRVV